MTQFQTTVAFMVLCFAASCGKNEVFADADTESAGRDIDANSDRSFEISEDGNDATEDAFWPTYFDITGAWTMACQSDLVEEVNFNLHFFFFQDGALIQGIESESEDARCHGTVASDGRISLIMEEPCTGSTVTFASDVVDHTITNGRYSWEWVDAYGISHHDEGVWYANPFVGDCLSCPNVAGDWTLTYNGGRAESTTITVEQIGNAIRAESLDGCEYLGAFSLTPECNDLRIYRRCPRLAGQTRVLFGLLDNPGRMSGAWYDTDDTFGCPEIRNGSWEASRP